MVKILDTLFDYTLIRELGHDIHFGSTFLAQDQKNDDLLLHVIPANIANFVGVEHIKLRLKTLSQEYPDSFLHIREIFTHDEKILIIYNNPSKLIPLRDFLVGKSYKETLKFLENISILVEKLHQQNVVLGVIDPSFIWISPQGNILFMPFYIHLPNEIIVGNKSSTFPFFAPEVFLLNKFDMRTDIYNLGIVFHDLLTGVNPNKDSESRSKSIEHMKFPINIKRLVLQMINKRPLGRQQWVGQIIDELQRIQGENISGRNTKNLVLYGSQYLFSPEFIGRKKELNTLSIFNQSILDGRSKSILISGMTGSGKKRLFMQITEEFTGEIDYYSSRAEGTSNPIIEQLVTKILKMSMVKPAYNFLMNHLPVLAEIFPKLKSVYKSELDKFNSIIYSHVQPEEFLTEFMVEFLAASDTKIVFGIFNAEKIDDISVGILKKLLSMDNVVLGVVGIVEKTNSAELYSETLTIEPLPIDDYEVFLSSLFGHSSFVNKQFTEWLYLNAVKSLTNTVELVQYLADTKQIYIKNYAWHMNVKSFHLLKLPESEELLISSKMSLLTDSEMKIYQVLSLINIPITDHKEFLNTIVQITNIDSSEKILQTIGAIHKHGLLLRLMTSYEFPSITIKEYVQNTIGQFEMTEIHNKIAEVLLKGTHKQYYTIGHHYSKSGNWRKAALFYLIDARRNFRSNLYSNAVESIDNAIGIYRDHLTKNPSKSILLLMGNIFEQSGNLNKAIVIYKELFDQYQSIKALIRLGFTCSNTKNNIVFSEIEQAIKELSVDSRLPLKYRIELKVILSTWNIMTNRDFSLVQELKNIQEQNNDSIRAELGIKNYIRFLYNTHNMLLDQKAPWSERESLILEAESLAEQYNHNFLLTLIYNAIGLSLMEEDLLRSKDYFFKSLHNAILIGNRSNENVANQNLFICYRFLGDLQNSLDFAEKVKELNRKMNHQFDTEFVSDFVEYYLFIEDYTNAQNLLNTLRIYSKQNKQYFVRIQMFLTQFKLYVHEKDYIRATKLWPVVKDVCETNKLVNELFQLECMFLLSTKKYDVLIQKITHYLETPTLSVVEKIGYMGLLIQGLLESSDNEKTLELIRSLEQLVYKTKYFGYLGYVYLYRGIYYKNTQQYIQARVNLTRAKNSFIKLTNENKINLVNSLLLDVNQTIMTSKIEEQEHITNILVNYEILLDSVKRINSSILVDQLSKNIAIVFFENFLFDRVHLFFEIGKDGRKVLSINEQIQFIENVNIDEAISKLISIESQSTIQIGNSTFLGFPIHSNQDEMVTFLIIEIYTIQSNLSKQEIDLITNILELVSPKIEKVFSNEQFNTDDLTGLFKRDYFLGKLTIEFNKAKNYSTHLSFIMLDLDDFSEVNNLFGHLEGDRVLQEVANHLSLFVRKSDIVGRYGGEEFIVILPNTSGESAYLMANEILNVIRKIEIKEGKQLTASIGVSSVDKDSPETMNELIKKADIAEIFAKQNGKNRVVCHWNL